MAKINSLNQSSSPFTVSSGNCTITSGNLKISSGNLGLPTTSSSSIGTVQINSTRFIHSYGTNNGFIGLSAGNYTLSGSGNIGIGQSSLTALTSGSNNVALGYQSQTAITTGSSNTSIGSTTLVTATTASNNVAVNYFSLHSTTTSNNTAIGMSSLHSQTSGTNNTAVGLSANGSVTASYSVWFGYAAGNSIAGSTAASDIFINYQGSGTPVNTLQIGQSTGVGNQSLAKAVICGINGSTSASGIAVLINASNVLGTTTSSRRFKNNVKTMASCSSNIYKLRPVTFYYNQDETHISKEDSQLKQYGLIAEEVEKIYPELVTYDLNGTIQSVRYLQLIPMLLNELQKMYKRITDLELKKLKRARLA